MDKTALGERVAKLRKKAKMSQDDLAAKSGVGRRAVQMVEKGEGNPTVGTLESIAKVFGLTFEDLISTGVTQSPAHLSLSAAAKLLEALEQASELRRAIVLAIAHDDPKYLDELEAKLPSGLSQGLRSISKAI